MPDRMREDERTQRTNPTNLRRTALHLPRASGRCGITVIHLVTYDRNRLEAQVPDRQFKGTFEN